MAQPLRIENPDEVVLITTRTANSRLWFVNDRELQLSTLGLLAKYQGIYGVIVYAFILMGNHYHLVARFSNSNRAKFMRDFNSGIAKTVKRKYGYLEGGKLWERRYSCQTLPLPNDIKNWSFYTWLNAVSSVLAEKLSLYDSYNSFHDATFGVVRKFKVINWTAYNDKKRFNKHIRIQDFTEVYSLNYTRLPGFEDLNQREYKNLMHKELEERRVELVKEIEGSGKSFPPREALKKTKPGSSPFSTKKSMRNTPRPLVLTLCPEARKDYLSTYFVILDQYKQASKAYLSGAKSPKFPPGTYKPPLFLIPI